MNKMRRPKRIKRTAWPPYAKKIGKPLADILKEKQKTIKLREQTHTKTLTQHRKTRIKIHKVKPKLHRKAVKARKKNVEKKLDWLLTGSCFLVCLTASLVEARREKKRNMAK